MAQYVQETYSPIFLSASDTIAGPHGASIGGFLATTDGSIELLVGTAPGNGVTVVSVPVVAGIFTPIPMSVPIGFVCEAELNGGATGTFFINVGG